ncbi:MAG: M16 family metallopeptidase [Eggerthellaceae bacterium]|jgi:predicted Zn-dependent peptidase
MNLEITNLDNGITVATDTMPGIRSITLGIWIKVGSRDEEPDQHGLAHFMEHMVFKGTPHYSAVQISAVFDALGAELNAFTSKEYTCLHARFVDEKLDQVVPIMAEMLTDSLFAPEDIENEREVVVEEIARSEDTPDDHVFELFSHALMPTHPLGRPVLGDRKLVEGYGHDDCERFHALHYGTQNLVVAAAGHVDHRKLVSLIEESFSRLAMGDKTERVPASESAPMSFSCQTKDIEQAHFVYGFPWMDASDDRRFAGALASAILGGSMSSRLFQEVREKNGLAYAVFSQGILYSDAGMFCIYCGTRPDNLKQALSIVQREVRRLAEEPPTSEEVERQCGAICGSLLLGMESTSTRMARLGRAICLGLPLRDAEELVERYRQLGPADVQRVAQDFMTAAPTLAVVSPFEEGSLAGILEA